MVFVVVNAVLKKCTYTKENNILRLIRLYKIRSKMAFRLCLLTFQEERCVSTQLIKETKELRVKSLCYYKISLKGGRNDINENEYKNKI